MAVVSAYTFATPPAQPQTVAFVVNAQTRSGALLSYIVNSGLPFFRPVEAGVGVAF